MDRPVLGAPAEPGVSPLRLPARDADLGDQLAVVECRRVVVDEELVGRDRAAAGGALGDDLGAQREHDGGQVAVRVGLRQRSADGSAVAHLLIADAAAAAASTAAWAATSELAATARCLVHAPITSVPPSTRIPDSSGMRAMSTSAPGADSRSFSAGRSEWPPASGWAPRLMWSSASATVPARS